MVTVFVSGATGYIAQHIVKLLIERGYDVVGSVRSAEKGDRLKRLLASDKFSYEIVKDIKTAGAFNKALQNHPEVTVFIHTASPFTFRVKDPEQDLLIPAVKGTENALAAIEQFGPQITRVVVTSSVCAHSNFTDDFNPEVVVTEQSWNPITWDQATKNSVAGYFGSKKFAEKAAWDFVDSHRPNFSLTCVNPVYVFGPQAFDEDARGTLNTSAEVINSILKLTRDSKLPRHLGGYVDVRDVAAAHLLAFEKPEAVNQRLLLCEGKFLIQGPLDIIRGNFPELRDRLPSGYPGTQRDAVSKLSKVSNGKTKQLLGFPLRNLESTTVDTVRQILDSKNKSVL